MNVQAALKTQYHAALAMLKDAIEQCPDDLWAGGGYPIAFWRVVYHTLFYTHLYLQPDEKSFEPWEHHRENNQHLGTDPDDPPKIGEPYTREQMLEYWALCDEVVDTIIDRLDLAAPECGFWWYKLPKLDHQINNIRHIQHHVALLAGRLRQTAGKDVRWVGSI
ncbi:MAG: hypothetical protein JXO22_00660 [Phycisphaerae bacterium]|nr:hypothetical protein [Phycisphaerae bacterium]